MKSPEDFIVTEKMTDEAINQEIYLQVGYKTMLCVLITNTGFETVGYSSPIDVELFDTSIEKNKARKKAFEKVAAHLESILQWKKAVQDIEEAKAKADKEQKNSLKTEKQDTK